MFKDNNEVLNVGKFLSSLAETGIKKTDPRLKKMIEKLKAIRIQRDESGGIEALTLDRNLFKSLIRENLELISRAFSHKFVIPEFTDFCKYIEEFYWKCKANTGGRVADYIPQLSKYNTGFIHNSFISSVILLNFVIRSSI